MRLKEIQIKERKMQLPFLSAGLFGQNRKQYYDMHGNKNEDYIKRWFSKRV